MGCLHQTPPLKIWGGDAKIIRAKGNGWLQGNSVFQIQQNWYIYTLTDTMAAHIRLKQDRVPAPRSWKEDAKSNSEPQAICNWWLEKEKESVFCNGASLGVLKHYLRQTPTPQNNWPVWNELHASVPEVEEFCYFCPIGLFCVCVCFDFHFFVFFCFCLFKRKEGRGGQADRQASFCPPLQKLIRRTPLTWLLY